jgi:hypothetical protein
MPINIYTERDEALIVKNVIAACKDITKLSPNAYTFIMLCSGFIAHYDRDGFIDYYRDGSLKRDILQYQRQNQWLNFRQGEENYDYYMQKKSMYNAICLGLKAGNKGFIGG